VVLKGGSCGEGREAEERGRFWEEEETDGERREKGEGADLKNRIYLEIVQTIG